MPKPMIESLASIADTLVRVFAILAALAAVVYLLSSRQLQKTSKQEDDRGLEAENQRAELRAEISQAHSAIEQLKSENLRLGAQVEQEHAARLQIQRRFGPRAVSSSAIAAMVAALEPYAGQKINFGYFTELETAAFAEQLLNAVKAAGWKPQVFKLKSMQPLYGVECGGPDPEDPALQALAESLKLVDKRVIAEGSGTSVMGQELQPQLTDQLWVMVGLKRPHLRRPHEDEAQTNQ